ncbi:hypothetical protein M378DRAFT_464513 [Amanita muscaria Koide BX008]|uniref:Uncharacterized protein n=1 Tax=Amanita muscaria (strain Koide BX008) TaxID=946122 RepID=A0A0C2SR86_AMAMK|nr:hypothetical protein M378DRAFT_464513 [Amanita muscaria Koide BX008]
MAILPPKPAELHICCYDASAVFSPSAKVPQKMPGQRHVYLPGRRRLEITKPSFFCRELSTDEEILPWFSWNICVLYSRTFKREYVTKFPKVLE